MVAMTGPFALLVWGSALVLLDRLPHFSRATSAATWLGWVLELLLAPAIILGSYAFLLAASAVAGYFFHPRRLPVERQNRAVALSCYACAPLALTPISIAAIALGGLLIGDIVKPGDIVPFVIVVFACGFIPMCRRSPRSVPRFACFVLRPTAASAARFCWASRAGRLDAAGRDHRDRHSRGVRVRRADRHEPGRVAAPAAGAVVAGGAAVGRA
jgi:hypothetical protein